MRSDVLRANVPVGKASCRSHSKGYVGYWADSGPSASGFADALNGLSADDPKVDIAQGHTR